MSRKIGALGLHSLVLDDQLTTTLTVTIANGQSLSGVLNCQGLVPVGVLVPSTWDAAAAAITFQGSPDNATFGSLYDSAGEVSYPAAAGLFLALNPSQFAGVSYLKIRSGTAGTPVNQTTAGSRVLTVILRSVL